LSPFGNYKDKENENEYTGILANICGLLFGALFLWGSESGC
jgi:hypothetical protein